ncbi:MAG: hypothetical protein ACI85Q_002935 [Salibacteraceae bacterium]|jgi:hypothetical protein
MMKKIIILASVLALIGTSCTVVVPGVATGNVAEKTGFVSKSTFLGITFKPIDLSIATAAKNGDITKIATMDYSVKYGFITKYKLVITGQ